MNFTKDQSLEHQLEYYKSKLEKTNLKLQKLTSENQKFTSENHELKSVDQELTFKKQNFRPELQFISNYFNVEKSLPAIEMHGSISGPSTSNSKEHPPIKLFTEKEFGIIELEDLQYCKMRKPTMIFNKTIVSLTTDNNLQNYVKEILEDIMLAANLESDLIMCSYLPISDSKAEFWAITWNGYPVAAIEVKKPEEISDEKKAIHYGQLFDYLTRIRSFHGIRNVLGLYIQLGRYGSSYG